MANENDLYDLLQNHYTSKNAEKETTLHSQFNEAVNSPQKINQPAQPANPDSVEESWQYKIGQPIYEALTDTRPGAALLGVGEGEHQALQSIANLFRSDENKVGSLGTEDLINPEYGGYHSGGKIAGNALIDYGLLRGAGNGLRGATGAGGLAKRMAASAGIMYGTGEHFPEQFGGRDGAAAFGALFPVTAGATAGEIGKNITTAAEQAEAKYGSKIGEALAKADPIDRVRYTAPMQEILNKGTRLSPEYGSKEMLQKFISKPSAQSAQEAMSAMKAEQRSMLTFPHTKPTSLPQGSQDTYHALGDAIKDLEKQIQGTMSKDVFQMFKDSLKEYAAKVGPYKQPSINIARTGHGPAKNIPKAVEQMEKYSRTLPPEIGEDVINQFQYLMKQHPELYLNLNKKKILGGAAAISSSPFAYDKYFGGQE